VRDRVFTRAPVRNRRYRGTSSYAWRAYFGDRGGRTLVHVRAQHERQNRHTRENQAVAVETLNIQGMGRTRLAKGIHDAGWGEAFVRVARAPHA